jgi:putative transposase
MSEYDMNLALTELKEQKPWLHNYHSKMLQMVGKKVAAARKSLSVLRKKGHKVGRLLHYLTHEKCNSFTYNQSGFKIEKKESEKLYLSKIGSIKLVLHRQPFNVKQVTVVRQNGKWYAVVACETLRRNYCTVIKYVKPVGIDVGITKFAHDSDSHSIENPLSI